jgi:hypothetical protein
MGGAGDNYESFLTAQLFKRHAIQFDYLKVIAANDQQRGRLDSSQGRPREVWASSTRNDSRESSEIATIRPHYYGETSLTSAIKVKSPICRRTSGSLYPGPSHATTPWKIDPHIRNGYRELRSVHPRGVCAGGSDPVTYTYLRHSTWQGSGQIEFREHSCNGIGSPLLPLRRSSWRDFGRGRSGL